MRISAESSLGAIARPHPVLSDDEVRVALALRLNVLLTGRETEVEDVLARMLMQMAPPIARWEDVSSIAHGAEALRTLVVRDLGSLPPEQQQLLNDYLDAWKGSVQVISTTPRSLLTRVERGAFIERLYYRLNTICLDLRPAPGSPLR